MKNKFILGAILASVLLMSVIGVSAQITGDVTGNLPDGTRCGYRGGPPCPMDDSNAIDSDNGASSSSTNAGTKAGTSATSSAKKRSSGSKTCPTSMTETTSAEGIPCCIPKSKATGRFLGFMFRN